MKSKQFKKLLGTSLSVAMLVTSTFSVMASETGTDAKDLSNKIWTLGQKANVNGPEDGKQGTNGWYFMYTDEIDVAEGTNYDVSKMKECTWANKGSLQLSSEGGSYDNMWVPDNYLKDELTGDALVQPNSENENSTFNNWVMTSDGTLNPSVETTAVTGIYAWEAPEDADYNYELGYEAGGDHCDLGGTRYYYVNDYYIKDGTQYKKTPEQREGGVAVAVSTASEKKDYVQCISKTSEHDYLYSGSFSGTLSLKKGERIYFIVDPREVGTYDMANLKITVSEGTCAWDTDSITYEWDDNNACTAYKSCKVHTGHKISETVEGKQVEELTPATCSENGSGIFEATFTDSDYTTQTATRTIAKTGHVFDAWDNIYGDGKGEANGYTRFDFAEDGSNAQWYTKCDNCGEMVLVEEATPSKSTDGVENPATCTTGGNYVYTASFYWGWVWATSDVKTTTDPIGHDESNIYNAKYDWTEDGTSCTKEYICGRCNDTYKEDSVTATVSEEGSCTSPKKMTASFDWGWDVQTKEIPVDHKWASDYTVDKEATAVAEGSKSIHCENCKETKDAQAIKKLTATIKLSATKKTIKKKRTYTLKVSKLAKGDSVVSFKSSKKSVATVTSKGKIKGVRKGKATITVKLKSGKTAKCKVTVK